MNRTAAAVVASAAGVIGVTAGAFAAQDSGQPPNGTIVITIDKKTGLPLCSASFDQYRAIGYSGSCLNRPTP